MASEIEHKYIGKSILVHCPKCGEWGYLSKRGQTYRIRHKNDGNGVFSRYCNFSRSKQEWDELDKIYKKYRGEKNAWVKQVQYCYRSWRVYIPKAVLEAWDYPNKVEMRFEGGKLVIEPLKD